MKQVAIYTRVSSKAQDVASQEPDLKRWADTQMRRLSGIATLSPARRWIAPAWNKLIADIAAGKVSTVVCWRIDRLGRTASGLTALFADLIARRVNLVSSKDGIDLNTAAGRLLANVLASVAAFETEVRAERVLAGQAVARKNGKCWGGSEKGRRLKVSDEQVKLIARMSGEGEKITAIARATGLSRPTIYKFI